MENTHQKAMWGDMVDQGDSSCDDDSTDTNSLDGVQIDDELLPDNKSTNHLEELEKRMLEMTRMFERAANTMLDNKKSKPRRAKQRRAKMSKIPCVFANNCVYNHYYRFHLKSNNCKYGTNCNNAYYHYDRYHSDSSTEKCYHGNSCRYKTTVTNKGFVEKHNNEYYHGKNSQVLVARCPVSITRRLDNKEVTVACDGVPKTKDGICSKCALVLGHLQ